MGGKGGCTRDGYRSLRRADDGAPSHECLKVSVEQHADAFAPMDPADGLAEQRSYRDHLDLRRELGHVCSTVFVTNRSSIGLYSRASIVCSVKTPCVTAATTRLALRSCSAVAACERATRDDEVVDQQRRSVPDGSTGSQHAQCDRTAPCRLSPWVSAIAWRTFVPWRLTRRGARRPRDSGMISVRLPRTGREARRDHRRGCGRTPGRRVQVHGHSPIRSGCLDGIGTDPGADRDARLVLLLSPLA